MKELTPRQQEVLTCIREYIRSHSYPPTIRDIAAHFAISVKGAHDHVLALKKKGYLKQETRRSRTMKIIDFQSLQIQNRDAAELGVSMDMVQIPVLGFAAAGRPSTAAENQDGSLTLHRSFLEKIEKIEKRGKIEKKDYFALWVQGNAMEGAGIMDGDMAIVQKQDTVRYGDIAVVQMDDTVTLKRFLIQEREKGGKSRGNRIRLQPEHPPYARIVSGDPLGDQDFQLLGRLVTIIRSY
ncbi:MAG: transcriptional repressor LexA [Treponema sp.]|jgi:repressor LexA|nr:transcriptional repressor LexA [Treponema sp.]